MLNFVAKINIINLFTNIFAKKNIIKRDTKRYPAVQNAR